MTAEKKRVLDAPADLGAGDPSLGGSQAELAKHSLTYEEMEVIAIGWEWDESGNKSALPSVESTRNGFDLLHLLCAFDVI